MKNPMRIYSKIGVSFLWDVYRIYYKYPWLGKPIGKFLIGICKSSSSSFFKFRESFVISLIKIHADAMDLQIHKRVGAYVYRGIHESNFSSKVIAGCVFRDVRQFVASKFSRASACLSAPHRRISAPCLADAIGLCSRKFPHAATMHAAMRSHKDNKHWGVVRSACCFSNRFWKKRKSGRRNWSFIFGLPKTLLMLFIYVLPNPSLILQSFTYSYNVS